MHSTSTSSNAEPETRHRSTKNPQNVSGPSAHAIKSNQDEKSSNEIDNHDIEVDREDSDFLPNAEEVKTLEDLDPEGFDGPSEKVVKPLTAEDLAAFNAAVARSGVIYISRIPPGMRPAKVRDLMSVHGEIGRVYLKQEGTLF